MIALIYTRVSTEEQAKRGFSLPEQLDACRRRTAELGAVETIEIVDDVGGDYLERPKLEEARHYVRAGGVRWFVCLDPDRFSRNLLNQLLVTDEIDKAGVELIFIQHNREKTAEGNLFYAIRGAISEFEKKKIIERTQRGKRGKAKQGMLPGHLDPYGYNMDTDADRLVVDPVEAQWVRRIYEWASDPDPDKRMGQYRIAARLNEMGVPAPRGNYWYRSTVANILHNPLYTGVLQWGRRDHSGVYQSKRAGGPVVRARPRPADQIITLAVPRIIAEETFQRVQAYSQVDKHRRSRGRTYLLTGIAICGLCGGHIQTKPMARRYLICARRYPRYRDLSAGRRAAARPCVLPHIQAEPVEAFVWRTVSGWITGASRSALAEALGAEEHPTPDHQAMREELEAVTLQIAELKKAQGRVIALVARASVQPEVAEEQLRDLGAKVQALSERQAQLEDQLSVAPRTAAAGQKPADALDSAVADVRARLDRLADANRISLVRRLVSRVVISGKREADWAVIPINLSSPQAWCCTGQRVHHAPLGGPGGG